MDTISPLQDNAPAADEVRTACPYCGVGCGVLAQVREGRIVGVRGDPQHPANHGRLCSKGLALHLAAASGGRFDRPLLRSADGAATAPLDWPAALDLAAGRFARTIAEHGPDSVAFYLSGQLLTEDYYVFNKLARALVGTNNIDTNSRLCMSSAVSGYRQSLGADAPPACYEDIDHAGCLFVAGSNMAWAHPVLFRRVEAARARADAPRLVVVDPRRTETAACADLHLQPLPGTDVALYHGILGIMVAQDLCDEGFIRSHTAGFGDLLARLAELPPAEAARQCGVPLAQMVLAARWFAAGPTLSLYCQGLNQWAHGTDNNRALLNLHLATGQIGRPGAGPLSLTGQPNAMGGREVGAMATLLAGHRDLADPAHREQMARHWGVARIPERPGLSAVELFDAVADGRVKALWVACTNPAHSMPDQARVGAALARVPFLVVQDLYPDTDTARHAHLLLPAAGWGEKEGTQTNSERRISRVRRAVPAPGQARPDWDIAADFARRLALRLGQPGAVARFSWDGPAAIFAEHARSTAGRDLDITGLDHARLEQQGPQQWPCPAGAAAGRARLYGDARFAHPDGRARFAAPVAGGAAEQPDARYPLRLLTGRLRDQWHGMSRTGRVARLFDHAGEPRLGMHAEDMAAHGLAEDDMVRMTSRRGTLVLPVSADPAMAPGQVFLAMHWGRRFLSGDGSNALTLGTVDPVSRQPELKHAAVAVERLDWGWRLVALRAGDPLRHLDAMRAFLDRFPQASCGLTGGAHPLALLRAAGPGPAPAALLAQLDAALEFDGPASTLVYEDARRGISKRILLRGGVVVGARLAGETAAAAWLREHMRQGEPLEGLRRWALAPLAQPPQARLAGRIVCSCHGVGEAAIRAGLEAGSSVEQLGRELGCGSACGSCLPELRRMAAESLAEGAA